MLKMGSQSYALFCTLNSHAKKIPETKDLFTLGEKAEIVLLLLYETGVLLTYKWCTGFGGAQTNWDWNKGGTFEGWQPRQNTMGSDQTCWGTGGVSILCTSEVRPRISLQQMIQPSTVSLNSAQSIGVKQLVRPRGHTPKPAETSPDKDPAHFYAYWSSREGLGRRRLFGLVCLLNPVITLLMCSCSCSLKSWDSPCW